jgi:hypothetical protein
MRVALTLAAAGATGKLASNPAALVKQGTALLGSSPQLKGLTDDVRGRLVSTGKAAAISALSSQINGLTDRLQERTEQLKSPNLPGDTEEDERQGAEEAYEEDEEVLDEEQDEEPQGEDEEEHAVQKRRRPAVRRGRARPSTENGDAADAADGDEGEPRRSGAARGSTRRSPVRRTRR